MCYQLIERFSACRCVYYTHAVDRCPHYGQSGHKTTRRVILVGYACIDHAPARGNYSSASQHNYSDSGYHSGQSHKSSSERHYR